MSKGFDDKLSFFSSTTNLIYTFGFQYGAIPVYKSLKKNDYRRIRKVAGRSSFVISTVTILACIFGYLTDPEDTPNMIIFRKAEGILSNDWAMTIAKIGVFIACVFSFPTMYAGFRMSFFQLVYKRMEFSNKE